MKVEKLFLNIFLYFSIMIKLISASSSLLPKCCLGSENFGVNIYSLGVSCADMINCCSSGLICNKEGKCVKNEVKKNKRKITRKKNKEEKINNNIDEPIKIEPEYIQKEKPKPKKGFSGPVRINKETLTKCLKESKSNDPIIKEILDDYKKDKESEAMKKVFSELKKNSPIIVECLNNQEHLMK